MAVQARGKVTVDVEECKGCGLCVESCPPKCLELGPELNTYGRIRRTIPGRTARAVESAFIVARSRAQLPFTGEGESQGGGTGSGAGGRTCGSSVKET